MAQDRISREMKGSNKISGNEDLSDAAILSRVSGENLTPGQKHNLGACYYSRILFCRREFLIRQRKRQPI